MATLTSIKRTEPFDLKFILSLKEALVSYMLQNEHRSKKVKVSFVQNYIPSKFTVLLSFIAGVLIKYE